eukprot:3022702-Pleurochrysis_carterae.AAC.1
MFTNGPVDWSSYLLKVATASCQVETAAGCVAAKRKTFLRNLLGHLLIAIGTKLNGGTTVLRMDNSAAVEQADHAGASKKTEPYTSAGSTTFASASSTAGSRRTSFACAAKWLTVLP